MNRTYGKSRKVKSIKVDEEPQPSSSAGFRNEICETQKCVNNPPVGNASGDMKEDSSWTNTQTNPHEELRWISDEILYEVKENQRIMREILLSLRSLILPKKPRIQNSFSISKEENSVIDPEEGDEIPEIERKKYQFPLKTLKTLDEVEEILKVDASSRTYLIKTKQINFPGDACRRYTRTILDSFISKELAIEFSFMGSTVKGIKLRSFQSLQLFTVIKSIVLEKFPGGGELLIPGAVRDWIIRCRKSVSDEYAKELTEEFELA